MSEPPRARPDAPAGGPSRDCMVDRSPPDGGMSRPPAVELPPAKAEARPEAEPAAEADADRPAVGSTSSGTARYTSHRGDPSTIMLCRGARGGPGQGGGGWGGGGGG
jgi:hypothetical protein